MHKENFTIVVTASSVLAALLWGLRNPSSLKLGSLYFAVPPLVYAHYFFVCVEWAGYRASARFSKFLNNDLLALVGQVPLYAM